MENLEKEIIKIVTDIEPWGYSESRKQAYLKIKTLLKAEREKIIEAVNDWKSGYDGYMTMMENKKSHEKGVMARELADELNNKIDNIK